MSAPQDDMPDQSADDSTSPSEASADLGDTPKARAGSGAKPPRVKGRKRRHAWRFFVWLGSLAVLLFVVMTVAVLALTERELVMPTPLTKRAETAINASLGGANVSIGQMVLRVDKNFVPRVTARHVGVIDPTGAEIGRLDMLRAALTKEGLFNGQFTPDRLQLSGAQITVRRRVDGGFAFDFGGAGDLAGDPAEVLATLDQIFSSEPLDKISVVEARDLTVTLEDARTGRVWQATDALISLQNTAAAVEFAVDFSLFNGTEDLAEARFEFRTQKGSHNSTIALDIDRAQTADVALQSPALSFLKLVDAPVSAAMRAEVDGEGVLQSYSGTLEIGAGSFKGGGGAKPLAFEGAKSYFDYDPAAERLNLAQLTLETDALALEGAGHLLLRDFNGDWPQRFVAQLELSHMRLSPEGLFATPRLFENGMADVSFTLDPFEMQVGQVALKHGETWLRGAGRARAASDGWHAALDAHVDQMDAPTFMGLWPEGAVAKTRGWMATNILAATYRDLDFALRVSPEAEKPVMALNWAFEDAEIRLLKDQPPLQGGVGHGTIHAERMTIALDAGHLRPADIPPEDTGVDLAGSVVSIPDISLLPATMEIDLRTRASLEAGLAFIAAKPFDALRESSFGPDMGQGDVTLQGRVAFPMKARVMGEDVDFALQGRINNFLTETLMQDQRLAAEVLTLSVDPSGLRISGAAQLDTARFDGKWEKKFGKEHAGRSTISGVARLDAGFLETFNVILPKGSFDGASTAQIDVALERGAAPVFTLSSTLEGARLSIPALGWSKPKSRRGALKLKGTAGTRPEVNDITLEAAGLAIGGGTLRLTPKGQLDRITFDRVQLGKWLDVQAALVGRGAGAPLGIEVSGGRLDLRHATFGGSGAGGGASGGGGPITAFLNRLQVTDGNHMSGLSANLSQSGGLSGSFAGQLNGKAPVTGRLDPTPNGPRISLVSKDAGQAVTAAGLLDKGTGGTMTLTLDPLPQADSYRGTAKIENIRVQSAPELAELLSLVSVVGLLDQLAGGSGILFGATNVDFTITPGRVTVHQAVAEGPSLGITMDGIYDTVAKQLNMQGVVSPVYFINALGQVVSRRGEGLFGFTYTLDGAVDAPKVGVNPLSILTPGVLRDIFRRRPATQAAPSGAGADTGGDAPQEGATGN